MDTAALAAQLFPDMLRRKKKRFLQLRWGGWTRARFDDPQARSHDLTGVAVPELTRSRRPAWHHRGFTALCIVRGTPEVCFWRVSSRIGLTSKPVREDCLEQVRHPSGVPSPSGLPARTGGVAIPETDKPFLQRLSRGCASQACRTPTKRPGRAPLTPQRPA
jgi:hypothetical protein